MSSNRMRFNRTLFTVPLGLAGAQELVAQLEAEDIELVLDARVAGPDAELLRVCSHAEMYYVHESGLAAVLSAADPGSERLATAAAHRALRHRTCLVADEEHRKDIATAVASVVRMRVLDIADSPAPIALPPGRGRL